MWRFIISIILFITPLVTNAQLFKKLEVGRSPFIRLSVDPTVTLKTFLQKADLNGLEATVDSEILQNLFVVGGVGMTNVSIKEDNFAYANNGLYAMLGADLNLTKYQNVRDRGIFFVGLRYGFATMTHEASGIQLDNYWGENNISIAREALTASWAELAFGIKTEFAKNFFLGWTGEAKLRTHCGSKQMSPYNIPGYGKNNKAFAFDINIFLSYAFTMKPKKAPLEATE